jgi:hypothetical protein
MAIMVTARDEAAVGGAVHERSVELPAERVTARELMLQPGLSGSAGL